MPAVEHTGAICHLMDWPDVQLWRHTTLCTELGRHGLQHSHAALLHPYLKAVQDDEENLHAWRPMTAPLLQAGHKEAGLAPRLTAHVPNVLPHTCVVPIPLVQPLSSQKVPQYAHICAPSAVTSNTAPPDTQVLPPAKSGCAVGGVLHTCHATPRCSQLAQSADM